MLAGGRPCRSCRESLETPVRGGQRQGPAGFLGLSGAAVRASGSKCDTSARPLLRWRLMRSLQRPATIRQSHHAGALV